MQNWCPYISMAERKMDSTWLCRSSYEGRWEAINTWAKMMKEGKVIKKGNGDIWW